MKVVIIRYNAGNIFSVQTALEREGIVSVLSDSPDEILSADRVIFPGVGEASSAMEYLSHRGLDGVIKACEQPLLGICLGMQLLCRRSEEGDTTGLGVFNSEVKRLSGEVKIPHVGWNQIAGLSDPLFAGLKEGACVYYVHSFAASLSDQTIAMSTHGISFSGALRNKNFYGVQFHPEKSGEVGAQILRNFLKTDTI